MRIKQLMVRNDVVIMLYLTHSNPGPRGSASRYESTNMNVVSCIMQHAINNELARGIAGNGQRRNDYL